MKLKIGEKEYRIEYSFEASLMNECVEAVIDFMAMIGNASSVSEGDGSAVSAMLSGVTNLPQKVLTMFHAGLLENHGEIAHSEAKILLKQYFKESPDSEDGNFFGMFQSILTQMGEDGFFKQIGLEQMIAKAEDQKESVPKQPQDHRPRAKKPTSK